MKRIIKNNYKIIIGILIGILLSITSVYAIDAYIESNKVTYTNYNKSNVEEAIDELYEKSGMHQEKWIDPILNGADPVLKSPLIPVEIKLNGDVYYANLNSEWYNYSEKRWANAVILIDNPSNANYQVGDHIIEDDIESYFVWIPRYQYKIWDIGKYNNFMSNLTNTEESSQTENALWKVTGNNTRIIDIKFGNADKIVKMNESEASVDKYYTHPAFTLGDKNLNGFWMGKFESGYKGAKSKEEASTNVEDKDSLIVKPNVYSWRNISIKNIFNTAYNYERGLDSHMLKNTEWGAVAYLSHSVYGIGNEVNINNTSDFKTGYSAVPGVNKYTFPGESTISNVDEKAQPWNTLIGYLASTTGNISGVYDMGGGTWEYMAACIDGLYNDSGFDAETLNSEMETGYIDRYDKSSARTTFNNRILGDATGEMGPFYSCYESNGTSYIHSNWYDDAAYFIFSSIAWFSRGGGYSDGVIAGQFFFSRGIGAAFNDHGFRLALSPI